MGLSSINLEEEQRPFNRAKMPLFFRRVWKLHHEIREFIDWEMDARDDDELDAACEVRLQLDRGREPLASIDWDSIVPGRHDNSLAGGKSYWRANLSARVAKEQAAHDAKKLARQAARERKAAADWEAETERRRIKADGKRIRAEAEAAMVATYSYWAGRAFLLEEPDEPRRGQRFVVKRVLPSAQVAPNVRNAYPWSFAFILFDVDGQELATPAVYCQPDHGLLSAGVVTHA